MARPGEVGHPPSSLGPIAKLFICCIALGVTETFKSTLPPPPSPNGRVR